MNKKVLSAILFGALMAGTGTFTSCIDTDEPAGIENLRGAKAELIRAKVEVEKANAAVQNAEAKRLEAVAAVEQANATFRQAQAKQEEAKAASLAAKAEADKAYYDKMIAEYEAEMLVAAEELKANLAAAKQWAAEAEFAYNTALKQIAIAEALDLDNKTSLMFLKGEIENRYNAIYVNIYANGKTLVEAIREAEEALYDAMQDKAAGLNDFSELWIPSLELDVVAKETEVATAEEYVAKLESFLEKDVETTDWRAEIEELNDSVEALKNAISEKEIEKKKALNSEEYLAAYQKVNGIGNEKGTAQLLQDAIDKHNKYANEKKLEFTKINLPVNKQLASAVSSAITAYNSGLAADKTKSPALTLDNNTNEYSFYIAGKDYKHPSYFVAPATKEADGDEDTALAQLNAFIAALDKATINQENIEWAELTKEMKEEAVLKADTAYQEALVWWEIAKSAVKGTATAIPATEVAKVTTAITAYNAAVTTLGDKITAYNTAIDNVYTAAAEAYIASQYNVYYWEKTAGANGFKKMAMKDLSDTSLFPAGTAEKVTALQTINTNAKGEINYSALYAAVEALYVTNVVDVAGTTDNEATIAQKKVNDLLAASKKAAKKIADQAELDNDGWEADAKGVAEDAVGADEAKAIENALEEVNKAVDALNGTAATATAAATKGKLKEMTEAWTAFITLANTTYAQDQTTAAKAALTLPTAAPATGWTKEATADADKKLGKIAINVAKVDETKVAAMMTLELKESLAKTALLHTTNVAFGLGTETQGRLTMPTEKEMKADPTYTKDGADVNGAWYAYYLAKEELQTLNDNLAQTENLAALKTAATAAKDALVAEIAANDKLFDAYHTAIVDAKAANKAAKDALDAITVELAGEINTEIKKLEAKQTAVKNVMSELRKAVTMHLHIDLDNNPTTNLIYADAEAFEKALELALNEAKEAVINAEKLLAQAEVALQEAKDGKYDAVADAQYKLDQLNAELARRQAKYEQALTDLETALAAIAE